MGEDLQLEEEFGRRLTVMEVDEIVQEIMMKWIKEPYDFAGGQEPTQINQEPKTNIESEFDDEKSDEVQINQVTESVKTEVSRDVVLQESPLQTIEVKKVETTTQAAQQQQPLKSIDNPIKMVDIYATEEKIKQPVINEIEDQIIKPDADSKVNMITLDQEQAYIGGVKLFNTFRGGTEFNLFNLCSIELQVSDIETMETIMFAAANQFQDKGQKYQDDMKDNPNSEANIKRKTQNSIKFQIEEEKVIEAYVTHWQEQEMQNCKEQEYAKLIGGGDHNFRHGAETKLSQANNAKSSTRPTASRLAGV